MEFYQVINNRRTVRELKSDHVSDEILERIIAAGIHAPTHNHQREWEFVILREQSEKGNEGANVAKVVGSPSGYTMPCYIGLGYPEEKDDFIEQVELTAQDTMHFGKW